MKIGLIDVDSHNWPNLALMKLSAWHKAKGDTVEWWWGFGEYDRVYMSKVFDDTYSPDTPKPLNANEIIKGGTGYGLDNCLPDEVDHIYPDYSLYPKLTQDTAYGFLTRGCPHRCYYCFAPSVLRRDREVFHSHVEPRDNIVPELRKQLEGEQITGKLVHLCFTCDPYPTGYDTTATREVIKALKEYGNHVQILTKGDGSRDFDLLDDNDWYGITYDGSYSGMYMPSYRIIDAFSAKQCGIKTWCSFEPVVDGYRVLECIKNYSYVFDKVKIGKLNYHPSEINWAQFGREAEALCKELGLDYYIKDSLRKEMGDI